MRNVLVYELQQVWRQCKGNLLLDNLISQTISVLNPLIGRFVPCAGNNQSWEWRGIVVNGHDFTYFASTSLFLSFFWIRKQRVFKVFVRPQVFLRLFSSAKTPWMILFIHADHRLSSSCSAWTKLSDDSRSFYRESDTYLYWTRNW